MWEAVLQQLSVSLQEGEAPAEEEALLGDPPDQDGHAAGQPAADGGQHRVHPDRDEGGGGAEAGQRVPRGHAQGEHVAL